MVDGDDNGTRKVHTLRFKADGADKIFLCHAGVTAVAIDLIEGGGKVNGRMVALGSLQGGPDNGGGIGAGGKNGTRNARLFTQAVQLVKEFLSANPHTGVDDVRISFLSWNQLKSVIKGTAVVMKVSAVRLEYDGPTRRGKIAVRLDGRDVPAARKWALENVGELANGKNVVLVSGKPPPPGASFSVGNERMTDDGLLEIEFKTE